MLYERKCRTAKCAKIFYTGSHKRMLCPSCQKVSYWRRTHNMSTRLYVRRGLDHTTINRLWTRLHRVKTMVYKSTTAQERAYQLAEEAWRVLGGEKPQMPRVRQILEADAEKPTKCYQCGLRLLPTDTVCPRCGWKIN